MQPGSDSDEVLYDQSRHRSQKISFSERGPELVMVDHSLGHSRWTLDDERMIAAVARAGFLTCSKLRWMKLDWPLITALIDRWRPETNTFHLCLGESTITLQDVSVILGLRIDGPCVTGTDDRAWQKVCDEELGASPPSLTGGYIRLKWLKETFSNPLPADATQVMIERHTRAYILHMIGTILFPDSSKDKVHLRWLSLIGDLDICGTLSWGSAVLAYLYREMSKVALMQNKELKGCLTLLQVWAWERLVLRPRLCETQVLDGHIPLGCRWNVQKCYDQTPTRQLDFYRNELDRMKIFQFSWEPYDKPYSKLPQLPPICTEGQRIWRARVPLICFEIVEMHVPDRVLRQFGLAQHVPQKVQKIERKVTKGGHHIDWANVHLQYIEKWNDRHFCIVQPLDPPLQESAYITWYWRITRRWIINEAGPPLDDDQQRALQQRYVPRGLDEREFINAFDDIEAIANEGLAQSGRGSSRPLFQRILQRIHKALNRTHEYLHDGREMMVQPSKRRRRGSCRNDDEAGPSQHVSGPSQIHTQPDSELVQTQLPEGRRRTSRVTGAKQRRLR